MTDPSLEALSRLRSGASFDWSLLTAVAVVLYVYSSLVRQRRLGDAALGIAFWGVELLWEMFNGLILHFSEYSALWTVAGRSSFILYVGLNIEISLLFLVAPIIVLNCLPELPHSRIAGVPSRLLISTLLGLLCVAVECVLNHWGVLLWAWRFWGWPHIWSIACVYIGSFWALCWCHDNLPERSKIGLCAVFGLLALVAHLVFACMLSWI